MAKAEGRRTDETAQVGPRRQGPERPLVVVLIVLAAAGAVGLLVLAAMGG